MLLIFAGTACYATTLIAFNTSKYNREIDPFFDRVYQKKPIKCHKFELHLKIIVSNELKIWALNFENSSFLFKFILSRSFNLSGCKGFHIKVTQINWLIFIWGQNWHLMSYTLQKIRSFPLTCFSTYEQIRRKLCICLNLLK